MAPQTYNFYAAYQYADPLIVLLHVSLRNSPRREAITQVILVFYHLTSAKNCRENFLLWFTLVQGAILSIFQIFQDALGSRLVPQSSVLKVGFEKHPWWVVPFESMLL